FFTAMAVPTGKDILLFVSKESIRSFVCFIADSYKTTNLFYLTVKLGIQASNRKAAYVHQSSRKII
ncbi:MAG: hypothetical protein KKD17_06990, partial [Nanoarchaeota archaeon]|nr:hypothetical protein [Nanoarchaeota archaeon]